MSVISIVINDGTSIVTEETNISIVVTNGVGQTGEQGPIGETGQNGNNGASAYQIAIANGFSGSEQEWLDSLVGPVLTLAPIAYASLPTGVLGMLAHISDSDTGTWGQAISGGGADTVLAFFNGSDWTVIGR